MPVRWTNTGIMPYQLESAKIRNKQSLTLSHELSHAPPPAFCVFVMWGCNLNSEDWTWLKMIKIREEANLYPFSYVEVL